MFGARRSWVRFSTHLRSFKYRRLCNSTSPPNKQQQLPHGSNGNNNERFGGIRDLEAYRDLDKLDFMKAAKILFSTPPKKKQFGLDFHLVQLFFALMPSLAVYLVAQYAHYEMRKMEAELELQKKAEEEEKAKVMEEIAAAEKEAESTDPELSTVKERLDTLEETVKQIVVETKKRSSDDKSRSADQNQGKVDPDSSSDDSRAAARKQPTTQEATSGSGEPPLKQQNSEKRGSHQDEKK